MASYYECGTCGKITELKSSLKGTTTAPCEHCAAPISRTDLTYDQSKIFKYQVKKAPFASKKIKKKPKIVKISNVRSQSAPPLAINAAGIPILAGNYSCIDPDIDPDWANNINRIRLAYEDLTGPGDGMGALMIDTGLNFSPGVQAHFDAIATTMYNNHKGTDATEGTGEAAAAFAILSTLKYQGFDIVWGFDVHAGASIDQIWTRKLSGAHPREYLIVEAKGVNQSLNTNIFAPQIVAQQMSEGWIIDRLARMSNPLGAQILGEMGVTTYVPNSMSPQTLGISKSYYGVRTYTPLNHTAVIKTLVVQARWSPTWQFGWGLSQEQTLNSFTPVV